MPSSEGKTIAVELERGHYPRAQGRRRGWLSVHCRRRDRRRISLNGNDTGYSCPKVIFRLRPGVYRVGFTPVTGGRTRTRKVRIRWGRKRRIWAPARR
jgi:hypothetical protein